MAEKSFVIKFLIYVIESFEYGIANKYGLHAYNSRTQWHSNSALQL